MLRQEWAEGYQRLESEREDPLRYRALVAQLEAVAAELRRRVGSVYELSELAAEYRTAEAWSRQIVAELPPPKRFAAGLTFSVDAAFHLYARGAKDYRP